MNALSMAAGPMFWLISALGAVALGAFVARLMELRRAHSDYADFVKGVGNVLARGNANEALAICDDSPSPVSRVVAAAIRHRESGARSVREAVDAAGRAEVSRLERRHGVLAVIAQISPLLGLVGTFLGFVRTLVALNGDALVTRGELLSGVAQALVSAVAGLAVAIPAHVMYAVLRARLGRLAADLEAAASEILAVLAVHRGGEVAQ